MLRCIKTSSEYCKPTIGRRQWKPANYYLTPRRKGLRENFFPFSPIFVHDDEAWIAQLLLTTDDGVVILPISDAVNQALVDSLQDFPITKPLFGKVGFVFGFLERIRNTAIGINLFLVLSDRSEEHTSELQSPVHI